jgi:hypothetical protein
LESYLNWGTPAALNQFYAGLAGGNQAFTQQNIAGFQDPLDAAKFGWDQNLGAANFGLDQSKAAFDQQQKMYQNLGKAIGWAAPSGLGGLGALGSGAMTLF